MHNKPFKYKEKHILTCLAIFLCMTMLLIFGLFVYANGRILPYRGLIVDNWSGTQEPVTAMVFGGGMKEGGQMSDAQMDRMIVAVGLYKKGKVNKLLLTGDDGTNSADEVFAMKLYAMEQGIPEKDLIIDPAGFNTFASCKNAKTIFGLEETVAISQSFHLPRILYFCNQNGINTIGISADLHELNWRGKYWMAGLRESLARLKGVVSQEIFYHS
jgi:vancomycin permeability regulator SanA